MCLLSHTTSSFGYFDQKPGTGRISNRTTIRLGTRGSKLALIQAHTVQDLIQSTYPEVDVEIVAIKTSGDKGNREVLGAFVKEIQESLLAKEIDVALHCLKDLPTKQVEGLVFGAYLKREVISDAIITRGPSWMDLPAGSVIGTGSVRRTSQLASIRSDVTFMPLVGNVDTRMRKLQEGVYDAIVLATAGLKRLGVFENWQTSEYAALHLEPLDILPAPGQAILVLEMREGCSTVPLLRGLNDLETEQAGTAERAFLRFFGTGCSVPVAAYASIVNGVLTLEGLVASLDGQKVIRLKEVGDPCQADAIGIELATNVCDLGARNLIPGQEP